MAWYPREYNRYRERRGRATAARRYERDARERARTDYGWRGYGYEGEAGYGSEHGGRRWARRPRRVARGYPVRGVHSYDLDYGALAGPTTEYSGRVGYAYDREWTESPRGPYRPRLAEIGREARRRRRLYGRRAWSERGYAAPYDSERRRT